MELIINIQQTNILLALVFFGLLKIDMLPDFMEKNEVFGLTVLVMSLIAVGTALIRIWV